jgi:hypothetical protein
VFALNSWYNFEIKATFSNTGTFIFKVDGVVDANINLTNTDITNTANQNGQYVTYAGMLQTGIASGNIDYDDLYISDDGGSAPHNDFLGICRVETLYVTSDNSVAWTPLSSTNASNVDDTAYDGDTTYNSTASSSVVDTFNHGSLVTTPITIFGVSIHTAIRRDDVSAQTARNVLISGGTTANGASFAPATSYTWMVDQYTLDPNTSAAWTASAINSSKIGYEHT